LFHRGDALPFPADIFRRTLVVLAALTHGIDDKLKIVDVLLPDPDPNQVRVRIAAAGICHSDLSLLNGTLNPVFPLIPGHEAAGVVIEAGNAVNRVSPGDHVVLNWAPACRHCWFCLHGEPWLCTMVEGVISVPKVHLADGSQVNAGFGVGAFAEEVVIAEHAVVPIPDTLPFDVAALLGCAALTGIGAVQRTAKLVSGESALVLGLGGIGLCAVAGAKLAGASRIIAVDISPAKQDVARAMGATDFLVAGPDTAKQVRALTEGRGTDHSFDCVGAPQTIRDAWRFARRGGRVTVVGVGRRDASVEFNPLELFHFNRTLQSSIFGSCDPDRDVPILAEQIRQGHLDLAPLVTGTTGLEGIQETFKTIGQGSAVRTVVVFDSPVPAPA